MILTGDRFLIKRVRGFKLVSEAICWWTNSKYSHVEPVYTPDGDSVDISWPTDQYSNVQKYFNGQWRVTQIRPVGPFHIKKWHDKVISYIGREYDLMSFIGFILNKDIENPTKMNCSEAVLAADKLAGILPESCESLFITPQSYWNFTMAGAFKVIIHFDCAQDYDFQKVLSCHEILTTKP